MAKILEIVLISLLLFLLYLVGYYTYKRIFAMRKILTLKESAKARVKRLRHPFASFFKLSDKPDLVIQIGKSIYLVRFINGRGARRFMHFASESFFITYSKMRLSVGSLTSLRGRRGPSKPGFITTGAHSVKILPKLNIPEEYITKRDVYDTKLVPVLILNPAPNEVSYVTEKKTSIKVAFTGDEIYGQKIFTATSFISYAERIKRAEEVYGD